MTYKDARIIHSHGGPIRVVFFPYSFSAKTYSNIEAGDIQRMFLECIDESATVTRHLEATSKWISAFFAISL